MSAGNESALENLSPSTWPPVSNEGTARRYGAPSPELGTARRDDREPPGVDVANIDCTLVPSIEKIGCPLGP